MKRNLESFVKNFPELNRIFLKFFYNQLNFLLCCRITPFFHPPENTFFRFKTPLNPGPLRPPFPNGARIAPRLGSDDPLFDAILLEVFTKQGVREIFTDLHDLKQMDRTRLRRKTYVPTVNALRIAP